MHSNLARVLIARGVIRSGSIIEAYHDVRGLSGQINANLLRRFVLDRASLCDGQQVMFLATDPEQLPIRLRSEQVVRLDGMQIDRIAVAQHLTLEGIELPPRPRRGRRPKSFVAC